MLNMMNYTCYSESINVTLRKEHTQTAAFNCVLNSSLCSFFIYLLLAQAVFIIVII